VTDPARIAALFTRSTGGFRFARWGRAPAPVVFGTDEAGAETVGAALAAVAGLADLPVAAEDPELGSNFFVFFCEDWATLKAMPHLDRLIPDLDRLTAVLSAAGANQYRIFGFDDARAVRICLTLLRYDDDLRRVPAQALATTQVVQCLLLWSDTAFRAESPVGVIPGTGRAVVKPWFADLIRAAYDPVLPAASAEPALAHRLAARMTAIAAARG
jgi:hypothetical protein